jgi:hypothetical protein
MRDDFPQRVKETLAKRVGQRCSNPNCRRSTSGPHADESRAVNVGVACHITAASMGGPRYDNTLSPSQRSDIMNGIWLCQTCAKLIDSDITRYEAHVLFDWKRVAEFNANTEIVGRTISDDYLPQPVSALHSPIPRMAGLTYHDARTRLLEAGWQPRLRHWSNGSNLSFQAGNGAEFWRAGSWEIVDVCPTGLAPCTFAFRDAYRNSLTVVTLGEEDAEHGWHARVSNWFFTVEAVP